MLFPKHRCSTIQLQVNPIAPRDTFWASRASDWAFLLYMSRDSGARRGLVALLENAHAEAVKRGRLISYMVGTVGMLF